MEGRKNLSGKCRFACTESQAQAIIAASVVAFCLQIGVDQDRLECPK
jgi:hypothetical protein